MTGHTAGTPGTPINELSESDVAQIRLERAAPLLLEALKEAEQYISMRLRPFAIGEPDPLVRIRSAIAAATRES